MAVPLSASRGRTHELWLFVNIQDAIKARKAAEEKYVKHIVDECSNLQKNSLYRPFYYLSLGRQSMH